MNRLMNALALWYSMILNMILFGATEYRILKLRNPQFLEMRINHVDEKELVLFNKSNNELLYFVRIGN